MLRASGIVGLLVAGTVWVGCASTPAPAPEPMPEEAPAAEAPAAPESEEPEAYTNTLRWTTASEVDNFGFDIYRGDAEEGPFERLTTDPLPGAGTVDTPTKYEYVDDTIDPHRAYWYYVEAISIHGVREMFTPVFRAKPKLESTESQDS